MSVHSTDTLQSSPSSELLIQVSATGTEQCLCQATPTRLHQSPYSRQIPSKAHALCQGTCSRRGASKTAKRPFRPSWLRHRLRRRLELRQLACLQSRRVCTCGQTTAVGQPHIISTPRASTCSRALSAALHVRLRDIIERWGIFQQLPDTPMDPQASSQLGSLEALVTPTIPTFISNLF